MHSHDYRNPDVFEGKHVVILGAGASGQDICLEVATKAEIVFLSHKGNVSCELPDNVKQQRPISLVSTDGTVHFDDGQQRKVDAILLCTGYEFSFPFLSDACNIEVCDNRVTHLYKHIFNTRYPTLSFIGLCLKMCPFPLFSLQAQYIAAVLSGKKKLPSEKDMNDDEEKDFQEKLCSGLGKKYAHMLGDSQWEYDKTIAQLAGTQPLSEIYEDLYNHVFYRRKNFLMEYKNDEYKITSDGTWAKNEKVEN
ncbi:flavin-containing monooxygenase FMO GS-OX-like 2 isoform X2 [Orbicella faveolata]|uniref:flavin-containing monooxygenase FMO GS-OX-like 2 isoform X2 n=1 Tax=Orbicella faveolata TaxID=48498 RepID=UPI0009E65224|nr:flavin-containing monooxygenase FMO GS-OX-like 2 isoform X2 [Orbicella faveolata]